MIRRYFEKKFALTFLHVFIPLFLYIRKVGFYFIIKRCNKHVFITDSSSYLGVMGCKGKKI